MEQTLGKRIMQHRKRMGLTQDALAERLGVTAQAVSKWENDLSCPDITMLPRLAAIFGITTDTLLGITQEEVHIAQVIPAQADAEQEEYGIHFQKGGWEFHWDGGRKSALAFPVFILFFGCLLLANNIFNRYATVWELLWPSALLVFGVFRLISKFSFFSFGCAFFGGYSLLSNLGMLPFGLDGSLWFPLVVILFGLSLLTDALRKPNRPRFSVHTGSGKQGNNQFEADGETFRFESSFGESQQRIPLSRVCGGEISVCFGEYTIDLSEVEEVSEDCHIEANCSFGQLRLLVPKRFAVHTSNSTAFAAIDIKGQPDPVTAGTIELDASANFGEIEIRYL